MAEQRAPLDTGASEPPQSLPVLGLTAVVGALIIVFVVIFNFLRGSDQKKAKPDSNSADAQAAVKTDGVADRSKATAAGGDKKTAAVGAAAQKKKGAAGSTVFSHPWLACTLKAHSGNVLGIDFSPNGKYLASCADDRTVHLWKVKEFNQKERRSVRVNVELDHLTHVRFSPDSKAFIGNLFSGDTVRVFKIGKKDDGSIGNVQALYDFPQKHSVDVINIGIASNGKYIMTCGRDTTIKIWDLKGELLSMLDSKQMNHTHGSVSPCGRFVASSGFTPDVKVWEVCFDKSGGFREVTRAFELKGHTASVLSFSFNSDSTRMASVSKDGTWRLWDTNVEYQKRQDPRLLRTWRYDEEISHAAVSHISLSPDSRTAVLVSGASLYIYSSTEDKCQQVLADIYSGPVMGVEFSTDSRYFVAAGDKHISVFYNVVGYRSAVKDLEEKQKVATTQAMRERLKQQIDETINLIRSVEDKKS